MKKSISKLGIILPKENQKNINGGLILTICSGTGTARGEKCTINGYLAACTGNGGGFWFY